MGFLFDLLVSVFPETADTIREYRESGSPVLVVVLVVLAFLTVGMVLVALP